MKYTFKAYGHENISCTHSNTLEITKDENVTKQGHCIIACKANFELKKIKPSLNKPKLYLTIKTKNSEEVVEFQPNPEFNDDKELVIRRSDVITERTLGINANKTSITLNENLKKDLKTSNIINITISENQ